MAGAYCSCPQGADEPEGANPNGSQGKGYKAGKAGSSKKGNYYEDQRTQPDQGHRQDREGGRRQRGVVICRGNHNPIKADITMESVKELGLEEGKECYAVIKATNVMFATSKIEGISARNQIECTIVKVVEGAVNGHVTIEDADGVQVSGSITNESIQDLGLKEGGKAVAIIKATDVMVAVD